MFKLSRNKLLLHAVVVAIVLFGISSLFSTPSRTGSIAAGLFVAGLLVPIGVASLFSICIAYRFDDVTVSCRWFDRFLWWSQPVRDFHSAELSGAVILMDGLLRLHGVTGTRFIFAPPSLVVALIGNVGKQVDALKVERQKSGFLSLAIAAVLPAVFLTAASAATYYRETELRHSYAVATARVIRVESHPVRSGCSTDAWIQFQASPSGQSYTHMDDLFFLDRAAPIGGIDADDPECTNPSWKIGDTVDVAYVPRDPRINRLYWGKLERGSEPHDWILDAVGAGLFVVVAVTLSRFGSRRAVN